MNAALVRGQQMFRTRQIHYNTGSFKATFKDLKSRNTEVGNCGRYMEVTNAILCSPGA